MLIDNFEDIQEGEQLLLDYGERCWENKQDEDDRAKSIAHLVEKRWIQQSPAHVRLS